MKYTLVLISIVVSCINHNNELKQKEIPVYFREYDITILKIDNLNDTIFYKESDNENFKIVFFDNKGKCYLEKYVNHELFQKGCYVNSLDTLKRYVSGRDQYGRQTGISVFSYFQPLKDGLWITYDKKREIKEQYSSGVLQK